MRIKSLGLALGLGMVLGMLPAVAQAQQQPAPTLFSIRSGETLLLRFASSVTTDCTSLWAHYDSLDILDGPKEISLEAKPGKGQVNLLGSGKVCPNDVDGANVMITAKDVSDPKEADLTFRVRFTMKSGKEWQVIGRYHLLMFPETSADASAAKK